MPQFDVFLSHNSVDKPWVIQLKDDLLRYGVSVWLDKDEIRPGDLFAKALEEGLANSRAVALIVSPEAMASGWVKAEYYRALSLAQDKQPPLQLIPVILREAELPGFAQDRHWVDFRDESAYSENVWRLVWGITGRKPAQVLDLSPPDLDSIPAHAPLNIPIESPYGTMPPDSRFYIERQADSICRDYLSQGYAVTVYVQAPRQMGKSSLMRRMAYQAKQIYSVDTAFIDFEKFTEEQFEDEEEFLIELCCMIGDALHIPEAIEDYWKSRRRSNILKCSNYVSQHIIAAFGKPFILAMDEVERLLTSRWRNDFFGMLRTWHNDRAWDTNFAQMTLFLSSSTEPDLFIDNPKQSPFNVARPIPLEDFTLAEVEELNRRHSAPLNQVQVNELVNLLGGHPFLTRLAFYLLATRQLELSTLLATATSDTGPFGEHLRHYWRYILDMPEVKQALSQICGDQVYPEDKVYYRLMGTGLIKKEGSEVVMRNQLYASYFKGRLCG
jgi:hypothetical protein